MLYSIGYATKPLEQFIQQLKKYNISALADVRSVPYSKAFKEYHQEALRNSLQQAGIRYVYLGEELGPRSKNPEHYSEGQVQFSRLMESELFQKGIERLEEGQQKGFTIALCCAEKDPAVCHRSLLIAWALKRQKSREIQHILHDGQLESQTQLEHRLMALTGIVADMFMDDLEAEKLAYQAQCVCCAYRLPEK